MHTWLIWVHAICIVHTEYIAILYFHKTFVLWENMVQEQTMYNEVGQYIITALPEIVRNIHHDQCNPECLLEYKYWPCIDFTNKWNYCTGSIFISNHPTYFEHAVPTKIATWISHLAALIIGLFEDDTVLTTAATACALCDMCAVPWKVSMYYSFCVKKDLVSL